MGEEASTNRCGGDGSAAPGRGQERWEGAQLAATAGGGDGCRVLLIIAMAAARFPVEQAAALAAQLLQVGFAAPCPVLAPASVDHILDAIALKEKCQL